MPGLLRELPLGMIKSSYAMPFSTQNPCSHKNMKSIDGISVQHGCQNLRSAFDHYGLQLMTALKTMLMIQTSQNIRPRAFWWNEYWDEQISEFLHPRGRSPMPGLNYVEKQSRTFKEAFAQIMEHFRSGLKQAPLRIHHNLMRLLLKRRR
jgi:hypothetical protein